VEAFPRELRFYELANGVVPVREWLDSLQGTQAYFAIMRQLDKAELGNFGDHRAVGGGVTEMRINFGPGYRVYFGQHGMQLVILLVGGSKATQDGDIVTAKDYWRDFNA
jgi:putative addiction module killer protein